MDTDLSGYTFTNGTKVTDWIASLPADDRERAAAVVRDFVTERKPLNMLQVKIRLTAPAREPDGELDDDETLPLPRPDSGQRMPDGSADVYNSPGPIRPTVDAPRQPAVPAVKSRRPAYLRLILAIVAVIAVVAFFTNPSRGSHVDILTQSVARATARSLGQDTGTDMFGDMFGFSQPQFPDDVIESLARDVIEPGLEYHDYLLWSTGSIRVGATEQTVTVGAFGLVRVTQPDLTLN